MIEIITTRFHEAYTWILPPEQHVRPQSNSFASIKRFNEVTRKKVPLTGGEKVTHACNGNPETPKTDTSSALPSDGLICQDCSKNLNRTSQLNPINRARPAVDILKVTQHASSNSKYDWGTYFPHLAQNLRLEKFEYLRVFDKVFYHKHVRHEIERVARDKVRESDVSLEDEDSYYEQVLKEYTQKAHRLLMDMRHTFSDKLLRLTSYVLYKLLPIFLSGVVAHPAQIEMIKNAQEKLPDTPMIFLPIHKSHLDYILVTFILCNNDIKSPQVAAGDNLNMPVFGTLLRGLGAFYIKRKIDGADGKKDYIYRSLLQAYLQESIIAGHNIEFFIEGGRTRTGKPNMPKSGVLSVIVEAFIDGLIGDAILVPVSINYEKLVDGNFVREQMGTPKKKESFRMAMASIWKTLNSKYGLMRIDFNEPFSLKELVNSFQKRQETVARPIPSARKLLSGPSHTSINGMEIIDKHRVLVDNIARHVVYDAMDATSIMSTNVVAYLLLNKYRTGVTVRNLTADLLEIRKQIGAERDFAFESDIYSVRNAVERGVELLGTTLIDKSELSNGEVFIKPNLSVPSLIESAYYSNTFAAYFALDAVVVTSLATVNEGARMTVTEVIDTSMLYCDILRYEFIFHKPCQDFTEQVEKSIERLCQLKILHRMDSENLSLDFEASRTLLSTLAPFNIAYHTTIECLRQLVEQSQMLEKDFVKMCLSHMSDKLNKGEITYGESISTDSIKNCLKLMEKWSVVEVDIHSGVRMIQLGPLYNSLVGIQNVSEKIERFIVLK